MKIYHVLGCTIADDGEVYGWTTYSYVASRQKDKRYIHVTRLGHINPGKYRIERSAFELDPVFDRKKHNNMCHMCYFTSVEKLVEFLRDGMKTMHQREYDHAMRLCKKMHPRKIAQKSKTEKANVG